MTTDTFPDRFAFTALLVMLIVGVVMCVFIHLDVNRMRAEEAAQRVSARKYHIAQMERTAQACSHHTCSTGTHCVLTERGTMCLQ